MVVRAGRSRLGKPGQDEDEQARCQQCSFPDAMLAHPHLGPVGSAGVLGVMAEVEAFESPRTRAGGGGAKGKCGMGGKSSRWDGLEYMCGHEHTYFMDSENLHQSQDPSVKPRP